MIPEWWYVVMLLMGGEPHIETGELGLVDIQPVLVSELDLMCDGEWVYVEMLSDTKGYGGWDCLPYPSHPETPVIGDGVPFRYYGPGVIPYYDLNYGHNAGIFWGSGGSSHHYETTEDIPEGKPPVVIPPDPPTVTPPEIIPPEVVPLSGSFGFLLLALGALAIWRVR